MIKYLDAHDIAAEIRFIRQKHKGAILIVEGEKDYRVLARFLSEPDCEIEIAGGKKKAIEALEILEDDTVPGILAVVDADFDRVSGTSHKVDNLILTDAHDLDLTIFLSPALQVYLNEHAEASQFHKVCGGDASKAAKLVMEACKPISLARLLNFKHDLYLSFQNMSFGFIDENIQNFQDDDFLAEVYANSHKAKIAQHQVKTQLQKALANQHDLHQVTNGHDAAALLGKALRSLLGKKRIPQSWGSEVESNLRLAFDLGAFRQTEIYRLLLKWQSDNAPFRLFTSN
jgi:hypothetical protein